MRMPPHTVIRFEDGDLVIALKQVRRDKTRDATPDDCNAHNGTPPGRSCVDADSDAPTTGRNRRKATAAGSLVFAAERDLDSKDTLSVGKPV
ncbi:MAG: hypothetical protein MI923_21735 [Phycisphaerales bacterium]|nr:hypothetical protein [Phycisphaerales bacterium]